MKTSDLEYSFPEELIALEPKEPCRVLFMNEDSGLPVEVPLSKSLDLIKKDDVLVVNNSGVKSCRVFHNDLEFLFLGTKGDNLWEVLFRSAKFKVDHVFDLPGGVQAKLVKKGRPQLIEVSEALSEDYFKKHGEFALPPYIQKLRSSRHTKKEDDEWYQLDWKKNTNSLAAPTASLHFKTEDLEALKVRGVHVTEVSLDVGLGTFLPLDEKNFIEQKLHVENYFVPSATKDLLVSAKKNGRRIWALGTTALRALESFDETDKICETDLFIQPGYEFKWVSGLLTNFHQPGSSLLALVMAFYGIENTKKAYKFAVENKFRLFSYGDLSIWSRKPL
jgi:S-adenosylmethionine:tRNA ribosyltransferase-isomerase